MVVRIEPGPGQESVWDYPRPPRVEPVPERLRVIVVGVTVADTTHGQRVLETAGARGEERATPQPGGFYGGWVTSRIVGPMKGEPGSELW